MLYPKIRHLLCFVLSASLCDSFTPAPVQTGSARQPTGSTTTQLHGVAFDPSILGGAAAAVVAVFGGWLYLDGAEDRAWRQRRQAENERYQAYQDARAQKAHIEPKEYWDEAELAAYDGTAEDEQGPILLAADGLVFNVYKGRNFYGPGGEYHLFAGRDATRFLARTIVEEETPQEAQKPLTIAERASLAAWMFTLKNKYEIVGKLRDFDPSATAM